MNNNCIIVQWAFMSTLNLLWKPVLSTSGTTKHYLSFTTNRIIAYEETWDEDPWDIIRRLFSIPN